MHPLEAYLHDLHASHATGATVKETSYYGALQNLLNEVGKTLKPRVRCVIHLTNTGAGIPDGGLFTADQFDSTPAARPASSPPRGGEGRGGEVAPQPGQLPARGAIEVKGPGDDVQQIARSPQVGKYLATYGQVLVTNYRDFVLVGRGANGGPVPLEAYSLAAGPATFWAITASPAATVEAHGESFVEYLKRVMLSNAPLAAPADLAWFLASYARDARARIEKSSLPALAGVRAALEEALGLRFQGEEGDRFFRSTLVQTLFYGIFSAWVLWSKTAPAQARFDWRQAVWQLEVPVIQSLFAQIAQPLNLKPMNLVEVLDWTGAALNRVDRDAFFRRFEEEHAVQYFYEPFLEAFDPELRKKLGVWYTPPEIVRYMVARVDAVLRSELGIAAGLADPNVYVLDPACGTGAYLVEVLRHIHATQQAQGADAFAADDLKAAAMGRVFGFEILPAPFVIAHLQLGLLLQRLGAPLAGGGAERAGVYLTNALTGWEPPKGPKQHFLFPALEQERDAAERVKQTEKILVVLGNPPYNAFAGTSPDEEQGLVEPYKKGLISEWGIKKFNLDDLYVRFFRLAERRIAEITGRGVVCYISNHSWISDPSFVVLRRHLLESFDRFWIENMHGNRKISEYAPDGKTSETIFAISGFSPGIQQGVAISLWVKNGKKEGMPLILFRDDLNAAKASARRAQLLESLGTPDFDSQYQVATPDKSNRYSFRPSDVATHYLEWPRLVDIASRPPFAGVAEDRQKTLIGINRLAIQQRMQMYFDPSVSWESLSQLGTGLTKDVPRFDAKKARNILLQREKYDESRLMPYAMRPFDIQWCYYSPIRPLWREPRPDYWESYIVGTPAIVTRFKATKSGEGSPMAFATQLCDYHMMPPNASVFPIVLRPVNKSRASDRQTTLFTEPASPIANLSPAARAYLAGLGIPDPDADAETAGLIWMHALAIGYAPAYLSENADGIRQDWPRVPLPATAAALGASAALGRQVAALLDPEQAVPGVTSGSIAPALQALGAIRRVGGGALDPAHDLAITVGWGHGGQGGVTMPGKGRAVARAYTAAEQAALGDAAALLGATTLDIYLNPVAYWANVPAAVWDYTIGGYQVLKKWLSYREAALLGRPLTKEEARAVTDMVRRLAAILLLTPALNANYAAVAAAPYGWGGAAT